MSKSQGFIKIQTNLRLTALKFVNSSRLTAGIGQHKSLHSFRLDLLLNFYKASLYNNNRFSF